MMLDIEKYKMMQTYDEPESLNGDARSELSKNSVDEPLKAFGVKELTLRELKEEK